MLVSIALMSSSVCSLCPVQPAKAQENSWPPISAWPLILYREAQDPAKTDTLRLYFPYERDHKKDNEKTRSHVRSLLFSPESDLQENGWYGKSENRQHGVVFPTSRNGKDLHPYQAAGAFPRWLVFHPGSNREPSGKYLRLVTPFSMRRKYHACYLSTLITVSLADEREDMGIEAVLPGSSRYPSGEVTFSSLYSVYYQTEDIQSQSDLTDCFSSRGKYRRGEKTSPKTFSIRILPFFCRICAEDYGLIMIFPLYSSVHYREYTLTHIIPFYGVHSRGNWYIRRFVLAPFIFMDTRDRSRGLSRQDIIFPFFSNIRDGDEGRTWLFPFYYHRYNPDEQLTMGSVALLPPYYFSRKKGVDREYYLWPFYGRAQRGRDKDIALLWLYPPEVSLIRYHQRPGRRQHAIFPLYSYDRNEREDAFRLTLLWPLFSYRNQGEYTRKTGSSWAMISYERTGEDSWEFRFLWRLIRRVRTDKFSIFELNPLYSAKSAKGKGSYWAILGGLLGVETTKDRHKRVRWLWIFG
ncbi:MAG: hypothetical protein AB1611_09015 [bacterium]